jgi:hypothetical protein
MRYAPSCLLVVAMLWLQFQHLSCKGFRHRAAPYSAWSMPFLYPFAAYRLYVLPSCAVGFPLATLQGQTAPSEAAHPPLCYRHTARKTWKSKPVKNR